MQDKTERTEDRLAQRRRGQQDRGARIQRGAAALCRIRQGRRKGAGSREVAGYREARAGTRRGDRQATLAWRGPGAEAQIAISPARREPGSPGSRRAGSAGHRGPAGAVSIGLSRARLAVIRASLALPAPAWTRLTSRANWTRTERGASPMGHGPRWSRERETARSSRAEAVRRGLCPVHRRWNRK